jgi:S-adenosylmethionine hydrolase
VVAAVVDPGVGTARRIIAAELDGRFVLAPDNGLLTLALARAEAVRAFDATPRLAPASATFHGRDVFAPLAARLAAGDAVEALGPEVAWEALAALPGLAAERRGETVLSRALSVDGFGNVVTSCDVERFGNFRQAWLLAPVGRELVRATTYGELSPGATGFLAGSQGYLELAVRDGSAAAALGLSRGDVLEFWLPEGGV